MSTPSLLSFSFPFCFGITPSVGGERIRRGITLLILRLGPAPVVSCVRVPDMIANIFYTNSNINAIVYMYMYNYGDRQ